MSSARPVRHLVREAKARSFISRTSLCGIQSLDSSATHLLEDHKERDRYKGPKTYSICDSCLILNCVSPEQSLTWQDVHDAIGGNRYCTVFRIVDQVGVWRTVYRTRSEEDK